MTPRQRKYAAFLLRTNISWHWLHLQISYYLRLKLSIILLPVQGSLNWFGISMADDLCSVQALSQERFITGANNYVERPLTIALLACIGSTVWEFLDGFECERLPIFTSCGWSAATWELSQARACLWAFIYALISYLLIWKKSLSPSPTSIWLSRGRGRKGYAPGRWYLYLEEKNCCDLAESHCPGIHLERRRAQRLAA